MSNTTHNQVRQVLMNELGLTREYVRGQVEDIVESAVAKKIRSILNEGHLEMMIQKQIDLHIRAKHGGSMISGSMRNIIAESAANAVERHLKDHLPEIILQDRMDGAAAERGKE